MTSAVSTRPGDALRWVTPIHIAFWLLVNPSGWRKALDIIDPTLPVNFSIASLTSVQRGNPRLWRFLLQNYLLLVFFDTLLVPIMLTLMGMPREVIMQSTWLALTYSLILPLVIGYAFGVGGGMIFSGSIALGMGFLARRTNYFYFPVSIAGGLTGCVLLNRARGFRTIFSGRKLSGFFTGILSAGILLFIGVFFISGKIFGFSIGPPGGLPAPDAFARVLTFTTGIIYAFMFTFSMSFKSGKSFSSSLPAGIISGSALALGYYLFVRAEENSVVFLASAAVSAGLLMTLLFVIPYLITEWVGGAQAAAVAAALTSGISWVKLGSFLVLNYTETPNNYLWAFLAVIGSLSFSLWRPIVFLPLTSIWNNILYSLDRQASSGPLKFFHLHAVFWEESQYIPWPGLDEYLLMQAKRDPVGYQKNAILLAPTSHRGTIQKVEIELGTRKFEACEDVYAISEVYRTTQSKFIEGPAAAIIRAFYQTSRDTETALNLPTVYQTRIALGRLRNELNLLQRELIFSYHPYTQWFTPVLTKWDAIFDHHIINLSMESSFQQEIENPFICGMPLSHEQEVFVGRTDIMARIDRLLVDPMRPPLHLYGQRRMGKTSLLLNLDHYLPSSIVCSFFDGQALGGYRNTVEVFSYIIEEIRTNVYQQRGLRIPGFQMVGDISSDYVRISRWVDEVEKILAAQNIFILIMLDEFEALTPSLQAMESQARDFMGLGRFIIQHRPHFKLLFVGSHTLDEVSGWEMFLFNAQVVKIGRLPPAEALQLITNPVKNFHLKYDPAASNRILDLTSGHPHLVQSICSELVMLKNEQPSRVRFLVTLPDVEEAARRSLASISFFFADMRGSQINAETAAMLDALADEGENGTFTRAEWSGRFPQNFDQNLALALKRDLIEQVDDGYKFQVEMIRRWFAYRPF